MSGPAFGLVSAASVAYNLSGLGRRRVGRRGIERVTSRGRTNANPPDVAERAQKPPPLSSDPSYAVAQLLIIPPPSLARPDPTKMYKKAAHTAEIPRDDRGPHSIALWGCAP